MTENRIHASRVTAALFRRCGQIAVMQRTQPKKEATPRERFIPRSRPCCSRSRSRCHWRPSRNPATRLQIGDNRVVFCVMKLQTRTVAIAGITSQPDESWMTQIARNLTMETAEIKDFT
jgi:hypothetical protein